MMNHHPFQVRGAIEGFYGVYYTFPERNELIRFLGEHQFNWYIYGPKNDRQHRARWWEPYPDDVMEEFRETISIAQQSGVTFCYAISPGVAISYASGQDFERLRAKMLAFFRLGVRAFSLLLDDIASEFCFEADRKRYYSYAEAHADLCNRVFTWLKQLDPACSLSMCPTDYYGSAPFTAYLPELGERLNPAIDIFYTGPQICSPTITTRDALDFSAATCRKPLIWDNYPVNDLSMQAEMHIGPVRGRDPDLDRAVKGICINLMIQAEASRIPLLTFKDYLADPIHYQPEISWAASLRQVAGEKSFAALRSFAETELDSCLDGPDEHRLVQLTSAALKSLQDGDSPLSSASLDELDRHLSSLDEACYHLKNRMHNLALRNNLLPWIEILEYWQVAAQRGIQALKAMETGQPYESSYRLMKEFFEAAQKHPKRNAAKALLTLLEYIISRVDARYAASIAEKDRPGGRMAG